MTHTLTRRAAAAALAAACLPVGAQQGWPSQNLRLIVP